MSDAGVFIQAVQLKAYAVYPVYQGLRKDNGRMVFALTEKDAVRLYEQSHHGRLNGCGLPQGCHGVARRVPELDGVTRYAGAIFEYIGTEFDPREQRPPDVFIKAYRRGKGRAR